MIYETLGLDLKENGSQLIGTCPFCHKNKFYVDKERGVYDCKVCSSRGNEITILGEMFTKIWRPALTQQKMMEIAKYRGLPIAAVEIEEKLGFDVSEGKFVWLTEKPTGTPIGLRTLKLQPGKKNPIHNLKGCTLGPIGMPAIEKNKDEPVYLCEGEWDRMAISYMLFMLDQPGFAISIPGASTFKAEWANWFQYRDVICMYDNDDPGKKGTVGVYAKLKDCTKKLRFMHWGSEKKDGYDCHDLVKENLDDLTKAYTYIKDHITNKCPGKEDYGGSLLSEKADRQIEQDDIKPIGVEELHSVFHKWLKLENCDLLDITMGVLWSLYLPGNPLWLLLIAPPSGSKSETLMPVSAWHRCHPISNMTPQALCSGFQIAGGGDPSLLAALNGKKAVITVKDLTPLLQAGQETRDEVFGILRDAYDGSLVKVFGNGLKREYNDLHFIVLAGVTPAVDCMNNTSMGERFLKFRADKDMGREDDRDRAVKAIMNCGQEDEMRKDLKSACVAALQRPFLQENVVSPSKAFVNFIADLAILTANFRAVAPTDKNTDFQTMAPMVEAPPRLATQFVKLAQGLALHFEAKDLMDPRITRLVKRVALHTPDSMTVRIIHTMYLNRDSPMSISQVVRLTQGVGRDTVEKIMTRLYRTGCLQKSMTGTTASLYQLSPMIDDYIVMTGIFEDLPKSDPFYIEEKK